MTRSLHAVLTKCGLVVFAVLFASLVDAAEIRFRSQAHCDGRVIRLGDVADVISVDRREREAQGIAVDDQTWAEIVAAGGKVGARVE